MKKYFFLNILTLFAMVTLAQSWNPYLNQGTISPAPLFLAEFDGVGTIHFNIGNTGSSSIAYVIGDELQISIELSAGIPNHSDPLLALSGTYVQFFDWDYNSQSTTYTGVQNQDLPGMDKGYIEISYKVVENSTAVQSLNGFIAEIFPPVFVGVKNNTMDDKVSSYTYTESNDFGDAPVSYGEASHSIDLFKQNGLYTRYIYLGTKVDPELEYLASPLADGDDLDGLNDEDGVNIPVLVQGAELTIPVKVTAHDNSYGFLMAWIDWQADGVFNPGIDNLIPVPIPVFGSDIIELNVSVPNDAVTNVPSFARFRVGNFSTIPDGRNTYGEVEDYWLTILDAQAYMDVNLVEVSQPAQLSAQGQVMDYHVIVSNIGSSSLSNITIDYTIAGHGSATLSLLSESIVSNGIMELGETWIYSLSYIVHQNDMNELEALLVDVEATANELVDGFTASISTPVLHLPALSVYVDSNSANELNLYQEASLSYQILNSGNVKLSNITLSEVHTATGNLISNELFVTASLDVGEMVQFSSAYTILPMDMYIGGPVYINANFTSIFQGSEVSAHAQQVLSLSTASQFMELLDFSGEINGHISKLDWTTQYEMDTDYFTIMRRHESEKIYTPIGTLPSKGNSKEKQEYSFYDNVSGLPVGKIFYMLHSATNVVELFKTDHINLNVNEFEHKPRMRLFPVPLAEELNIELFGISSDRLIVNVINPLGQIIYNEQKNNSGIIQLFLGRVLPGVYQIQVVFEDQILIDQIVKY